MQAVAERTLFDRPAEAQTAFEQFLSENPRVWELFIQFTFDVIKAGHDRFSADSVLHRIRWETAVISNDPHFKINNNWSADFARKFMQEFPEYEGFFELRKRHHADL